MRKQYHIRPSKNGYYAWDVHRLVALSSHLTPQKIPLSEISELDENYWFGGPGDVPTCREIGDHARLIDEADLAYPIILCSNRRVMDGMHRVLKAVNAGLETIDARVFEQDPEPDYTDVLAKDLYYEDDDA